MKKNIFHFSIILLISILGWSGSVLGDNVVNIAPGHQKVIAAPGIRRAAIGNPEVADVKALAESEQVIVNGIAPGSTDLILWSKDGKKQMYRILVNRSHRDIRKEVSALLKDIEGISIEENAGKIILDGQVYRGEDLNRIEKVLKMYPQVTNLAQINAEALAFFGQQVEAALANAGFHEIKVQPGGDTLYLQGEVAEKKDIEQAKKIAESVFPRISSKITEGVALEKQVLVDVKMMEIRKSSLADIGLKWPGQIDASGQAMFTSGASSASAVIGQDATVSLRSLIEKGAARILSNPRLLCQNNKPASFLAGGEIPIRLISERTANVIFKEYGVSLDITVKTGKSSLVSMDIQARISDLDPASAIDGIPGILEHRVKTAANLRMGDTVVLAGLIENRSRKNVQKIPLLGHIPVLGELFKSRSFQQSESEFLVFLTPIPGDAGSFFHEKEIKSVQGANEDIKKEIEFSVLD